MVRRMFFITGERRQLLVTRRRGERYHKDCLQSVYRSGKIFFMVWGAIGWGFKSPLVFLDRVNGTRGINSVDYADQVLADVVKP